LIVSIAVFGTNTLSARWNIANDLFAICSTTSTGQSSGRFAIFITTNSVALFALSNSFRASDFIIFIFYPRLKTEAV